jgi:hypothetical protein
VITLILSSEYEKWLDQYSSASSDYQLEMEFAENDWTDCFHFNESFTSSIAAWSEPDYPCWIFPRIRK